MHQRNDDIVVFRRFANSIDANIVKTKLDAFDIPCFLTDENINNLYPGLHYSSVGFHIRLHIFAADLPHAQKIVEEITLLHDADTETVCPRCLSRNVERDFPKKMSLRFLSGLSVLFLGIFMPQKKVYRCLSCENEFN